MSQRATQPEIARAYRELASRYHPDKHRGNDLEDLAEEKLRQLNEAYHVLSDPNRRAAYDAQRLGGPGPMRGGVAPPPATLTPSRLLQRTVMMVVILVLAFLALRFIRSPRAMIVVAAALLIAWFGPRLWRKLRGRR